MVPIGVALTHGHLDHVAALGRLKDLYEQRGYKLAVAIHTSDRKFLGPKAEETHMEYIEPEERAIFGEFPVLPKPDVKLRDGEKVLTTDLLILETPGHTPGSVCFYSEREGILFSGDTLFFDGVGRSDLRGGNEKKLRDSIQKKIMVLPPETRVFPGHGPFTTIEREKQGNPYFRS
jgi:hydroxyacylglutathione hydrolase